jgi:hypothetical protein
MSPNLAGMRSAITTATASVQRLRPKCPELLP